MSILPFQNLREGAKCSCWFFYVRSRQCEQPFTAVQATLDSRASGKRPEKLGIVWVQVELLNEYARAFICQGNFLNVSKSEKFMKLVFDAKQFSFELLRNVGYAVYGGSDIGECLSTAYRIKEGDMESWYTEWYKTADRLHKLADDCLARGHTVSAHEAYLRTSTYYRMAEFFLHGNPTDSRILPTWQQSVSTFRSAAKLFSPQWEPIEIPYEETTLPGYFYKADDSGKPRSTLIFGGGQDNTVEELYLVGAAALRRGYNCLTFDGPGQGRCIREQGLHFRFDWEKVVTPVVDYALTRPEIDAGQLAFMGFSMGGYLAARAAAFEKRIKALILFNGVYDLQQSTLAQMPKSAVPLFQAGNIEAFNAAVETAMQSDTVVRWSMTQGMWSIGASSPAQYISMRTNYTLKGVANKITCPTLVLEAENDHLLGKGQPQQVFNAITVPKEFISFTAEEGAEEHCQVGANLLCDQRIFDWLDQTLAAIA